MNVHVSEAAPAEPNMYRYDEFDQAFVGARVEQFRGQVERRLEGRLTEDEFKPLRLMNGLYHQLHAYMLRVAVPYGTLSARQMRMLARIAERYDRGYGHFTTRQNIQYNWIRLEDAADILADLASVEMHAIQTSGNCIRNTTTDQYAGAAADELADPRPVCELIRQWSTLHPEFTFLPRKFKIAVTGSPNDRAAVKVHDIGLRLHLNSHGQRGWEVIVGGGQGRTPLVGVTIRDWLPEADLLPYLTAIMRVYNLQGRRDNKYKARIKILVHELGAEAFRDAVEAEFAVALKETVEVDARELERIAAYFAPPAFQRLDPFVPEIEEKKLASREFRQWVKANTFAHKQPGYTIVNASLKPAGGIPGDASAAQMYVIADLAERYSFGEVRVTHAQNLTLPHVRTADLIEVWQALQSNGMAEANIGLIGDIIACPGLDYCSLATARSIPVAQDISRRFADITRQHDVGPLKLNISGCINACGHHHVGHIGILGVDKKGHEYYQLTLGGSSANETSLGEILGPGFGADEIAGAVETVVETYLKLRTTPAEDFLTAYRRLGAAPFKEALYSHAGH